MCSKFGYSTGTQFFVLAITATVGAARRTRIAEPLSQLSKAVQAGSMSDIEINVEKSSKEELQNYESESASSFRTPLMYAICSENRSTLIIKYLLENACFRLKNLSITEETEDSSRNLLHFAAATGNAKLVKLFLSNSELKRNGNHIGTPRYMFQTKSQLDGPNTISSTIQS